jgi:hypothetical protein
MPKLTRDFPEAPPPAEHGFVTTPPAALGDPFTVTVPSFSGEHHYEITRWMPRGEVLPKAGDEVLVVKDERGEAWVVAWEPA